MTMDDIPVQVLMGVFQEIDIMNRLRLARVSSCWKDVMSSPSLKKALHMDFSEMGCLNKYPSAASTVHSTGSRDESSMLGLLDQFGRCFIGHRIQSTPPHGSTRDVRYSFTGLMRFVTPRTRVLYISFAPYQFPVPEVDPVGRRYRIAIANWKFWAQKFTRVVTNGLAYAPGDSVTHLALGNFWIEGRPDLWINFKYASLRANELARDRTLGLTRVALKGCRFLLEARFWANDLVAGTLEQGKTDLVPLHGCVFQSLPNSYPDYIHVTDEVVELYIQDPPKTEKTMLRIFDKYSADLTDEVIEHIRDRLPDLMNRPYLQLENEMWTSKLRRMEPELFGGQSDIDLRTVEWKLLKKTTIHFFLSFWRVFRPDYQVFVNEFGSLVFHTVAQERVF
ncbi:hypothetical protein RvY_10251 [Ramazzottius varieornatus]|uniref:F-box domain-containing protein n=1 Tax=Ramazzottius varieornatus TaxID=947166 RepID=A0A1D1VC65_RAMVA|nr:hypothetical protein RvY_10251 [Ramazzottius varieornatus]